VSCKILDPDWSFEVAEDGFVYGKKRYEIDDAGYLVSPYRRHRPNDFIVVSDRPNYELISEETFSVKRGIHGYLNKEKSIIGMHFDIRILPEDIILVGSFGNDDSIVAMKIEIINSKIKKDKKGLRLC